MEAKFQVGRRVLDKLTGAKVKPVLFSLSFHTDFPKAKYAKARLRWKRNLKKSSIQRLFSAFPSPLDFGTPGSHLRHFFFHGFWSVCSWISSSLGSVDVSTLLKWNLPCGARLRDVEASCLVTFTIWLWACLCCYLQEPLRL